MSTDTQIAEPQRQIHQSGKSICVFGGWSRRELLKSTQPSFQPGFATQGKEQEASSVQ